jgi:hypothetical protein
MALEIRQHIHCACNLGKESCLDRLLKHEISHQCSSIFMATKRSNETCQYRCSELCNPKLVSEAFICRWCNDENENDEKEMELIDKANFNQMKNSSKNNIRVSRKKGSGGGDATVADRGGLGWKAIVDASNSRPFQASMFHAEKVNSIESSVVSNRMLEVMPGQSLNFKGSVGAKVKEKKIFNATSSSKKVKSIPKKLEKGGTLVTVIWGERRTQHVPLMHCKAANSSMINFPWDRNSCAFDATISMLWVIYQLFQKRRSTYMKTFRGNFPTLVVVFDDFYDGKISNIEAKDRFVVLFSDLKKKDPKFLRDFISTDLITTHLDSHHIYDPMNYREQYTFQYKYGTSQYCDKCILTVPDEKSHRTNEIMIPEDYYKESIQESLNDFLERDLLRPAKCQICSNITKTIRRDTEVPNILRLKFCRGIKELPMYCDKEIKLDDVLYEIVGAIYGSGSHFITRYLHDGKVFESDGMRECASSGGGFRTVMEALSGEIEEPYEIAMGGRIEYLRKRQTHKCRMSDVYYIRR